MPSRPDRPRTLSGARASAGRTADAAGEDDPPAAPASVRASADAQPTTAHRSGPTLAEARDAVAAFAARTAAGPWQVDRAAFAARLAKLVDRPDLLQQRRLNLCGPAAFLRAWAIHDPAAFARFATALYDDGRALIGPLVVQPSPGSLIDADYDALVARYGRGYPDSADWMVMGALRDSENTVTTFRGLPNDRVSGMTFAGDIVRWLRATGLYRSVVDETTRLVPAGVEHALSLRPSPTTDILMLINLHLLRELQQPTGRRRAATFLLNAFPDHWAALAEPVQILRGDRLRLSVWSWGTVITGDVARETFRANYYGAVVALGNAVALRATG